MSSMIKQGLKVEVDYSSSSEAGLNIQSLAITCGCHYQYSYTV